MSWIALANITLSSAQSTVTFSNIPTSVNGTALRDLVLVIGNLNMGSTSYLRLLPNNNSSNFSVVRMYGHSGGATSDTLAVSDFAYSNNQQTAVVVQIMDYAQTDKHKSFLTRWNNSGFVGANASRWGSTTAISSIVLDPATSTFNIGSTFALYGIAG